MFYAIKSLQIIEFCDSVCLLIKLKLQSKNNENIIPIPKNTTTLFCVFIWAFLVMLRQTNQSYVDVSIMMIKCIVHQQYCFVFII